MPVVLSQVEGPIYLAEQSRADDEHEAANLHYVLEGWAEHPTVVAAESWFAGYPAYDALPRIVGIEATAQECDGQSIKLTTTGDADPEQPVQRMVKAITARLLIRRPGAPGKEAETLHTASLPFFFTAPADCDFPGLVAAHDTRPADLARALCECFFTASDDVEADSYERQYANYHEEALALARSLLLSETDAAIARALDALRDIGWCLRALPGSRIELLVGDGKVDLTLTTANGKAQTATIG